MESGLIGVERNSREEGANQSEWKASGLYLAI